MSDMKIEQIRALMSKTIENGATEAEAMQAIALAKKLMAKHGLTMDDIKNKTVNIEDYVWGSNAKTYSKRISSFEKMIAIVIGKYTNTKPLLYSKEVSNDKHARDEKIILFFGHKIDVELAVYMMNMCSSALKTEWAKYVASSKDKIHGNRLRSFSIGMCESISKKIEELMVEEETTTSNELIVVKNAIIVSLFEEATKGLKDKKNGLVVYEKDDSYSKGVKAGEKVNLHREFSDKKVLKIGSS